MQKFDEAKDKLRRELDIASQWEALTDHERSQRLADGRYKIPRHSTVISRDINLLRHGMPDKLNNPALWLIIKSCIPQAHQLCEVRFLDRLEWAVLLPPGATPNDWRSNPQYNIFRDGQEVVRLMLTSFTDPAQEIRLSLGFSEFAETVFVAAQSFDQWLFASSIDSAVWINRAALSKQR